MATRISGLASGLDVDALVTQLMKAQRTKVDKVFQKRVAAEYKQEKYREISTQIVDFRNNKLATYKLSSNLNAKVAEVTGDTGAISAKSTTTANIGTLTASVKSVASSAYTVLNYSSATSESTLSELGFSGTSMTVGGVEVNYDIENDTLQTLTAAINAASGSTVTATYDGAGAISLTNKSTGAGTIDSTGFTGYDEKTEENGTDAVIVVNGLTYTQASNKLTVNGVEITANAVSSETASTITTTADTSKMLETIKSFITDYNALISSVNTALNETKYRTYPALTEDQRAEMSDAQAALWDTKTKSGLLRNDTILSSMVSSMRSSAISFVGTSTADAVNIQSFGITTGDYTTNGKLVIADEDALLTAIEANPDGFVNLLIGSGTDSTDTANGSSIKGQGIFNQLTTTLMTSLKQLSTSAGTSMYSTDTTASFLETSLLSIEISKLESREDDLNAWLDKLEDSYYAKFTAMETAINKFNSQSASLTTLLS